MILRKMSLFSQLLDHFPRNEFDALCREHGAERAAKGFTCWTQLVAMLFCHLGRADSLREICNGLACCVGKMRHLGILKPPKKSTLSYANAHRPAALFEDLFYATLKRLRDRGGLGERKKKFRFKNKLLSLDSTTVSLCLSLFPWASFRRTKGGVEVHVLFDHDDYMPAFVSLSDAAKHDRIPARALRLKAGSIIAMDRAYNDYRLFGRWCEQGVYFVTRMKSNAVYEVLEARRALPKRNILRDEIIRLNGVGAEEKCAWPLRRVVVWSEKKQEEIVLLTNHLDFGATTVAAMLRLNLFTYRSLLEWLRHPFGQPEEPPDGEGMTQLEIPIPGFGQPTSN